MLASQHHNRTNHHQAVYTILERHLDDKVVNSQNKTDTKRLLLHCIHTRLQALPPRISKQRRKFFCQHTKLPKTTRTTTNHAVKTETLLLSSCKMYKRYHTFNRDGHGCQSQMDKHLARRVVGQQRNEGSKLNRELQSLSKEYKFRLDILDEEAVKLRKKAEERKSSRRYSDVSQDPLLSRSDRELNASHTRQRGSLDVSKGLSSQQEGDLRRKDDVQGKDTSRNITGEGRRTLRRMSEPVATSVSLGERGKDSSSGRYWRAGRPTKKFLEPSHLVTILDNEAEMDDIKTRDGQSQIQGQYKWGRRCMPKSRTGETLKTVRDVSRRQLRASLPSSGQEEGEPDEEIGDFFKDVRDCRYLRIPKRKETISEDLGRNGDC